MPSKPVKPILNSPTSQDVDIDKLAKSTVFLDPEKHLLLGQLWKNQSVVLIFLRHFACIACRAHAAQVWGEREKFERSGAKLVFVGNGQPNWIEHFRTDLGIERGVILTDPSLQSFEAAGFKNGFFNLVRPQSAINILKLTKAGHKQTPYTPDAGSHFQMGGVLAINPSGKVLYRFASEALGDFPEEDPYLEVIRKDGNSAR